MKHIIFIKCIIKIFYNPVPYMSLRILRILLVLFCILFLFLITAKAQDNSSRFKVIAFYTAKNDQAHISFVHEANKWFSAIATKCQFTYDSTNDWNNLNPEFLSNYKVVLFLDTRPDSPAQRIA